MNAMPTGESISAAWSVPRVAAACLLAVFLGLQAAAAEPTVAPVPFGTEANAALADDRADDRQGGWLDLGINDLRILPTGAITAAGIPFTVSDGRGADGRACVVLGGPRRPYLPERAALPVAGLSGKCLYLLHAAAWCPPTPQEEAAGTLTVAYDGAPSDTFGVRFGRDVGDWTSPESYANAARAWTAYNATTQVSLFVSRFPLKDRPVVAVRFDAGQTAWMVVAASVGAEATPVPLKAELTLGRRYDAPALDTPLPDTAADARAPRSIVLVIGDGMGQGAIRLTSLHEHGAEGRLVMEQFPVAGLCTTSSASADVTDSAAASTAFACGRKTTNGTLGQTPDGARLTSLAEAAQRDGRSVGLITSDPSAGATPAGFYAHAASRGDYDSIAVDAAACGFDLLVGDVAGRAWFVPEAGGGRRRDGRDLLSEMSASGWVVAADAEAVAAAPAGRRVLGFLSAAELAKERVLGQLCETALARLDANPRGFFLMLESARPDHGGHSNTPDETTLGTVQADWVARTAVEYARRRGDTLVLVTADHETGGVSCVQDGNRHRPPAIRYATTGHTGTPVAVYAFGPGSRLFTGVIDNTDIALNICHLWQIALPPPAEAKAP